MFKRLFNWIKFKTLPPSVNFKNRLFLERDSKSRRITSNLGLTFRNSKWADYTRTDINLNLRYSSKQTLSFLFFVSFLFLCGIYVVRLYNPALLSNEITFFLWAFKDLLIYHFFSLLTFVSLTLTVGIEKFYVNVVGWFFLKKPNVQKLSQDDVNMYPKSQDLKHTLYRWLKVSKSPNVSDTLEPLTKANSPQKQSLTTSIDLKNLFSASNLVATLRQGGSNAVDNESSVIQRTERLILNSPTQTEVSLGFLDTKATWGLKLNSHSTLKRGPLTAGFFSYSHYQNLFNKIQTSAILDESLRSQLMLLKSNRFLYNYSFLHRKVLKNTHKITTIKRLLGVTWYDSKLISKNIWASDTFNSLLNSQAFLKSGLDLSYGSLARDKSEVSSLKAPYSLNEAQISFDAFRHYEESFFWLMKRIYRLNHLTLANNSLSFQLIQANFKNNQLATSGLMHSTPYSAKLIDNLFTIDLQNSPVTTTTANSSLPKAAKDLFISFWENDLLTGDDELLLAEFTSTPTYKKNLLPSNTTLCLRGVG